VFASRSNATATLFEKPVTVSPPAGTPDSFALAASAQANTLDLLGTFGGAPGNTPPLAIWSTQLLPGEDVTVAPLSVKSGAPAVATVRVADAGVPLAGALVTALSGGAAATVSKKRGKKKRSASALTNAAGVAHLRLGAFRRTTSVRLSVSKAGYATRTVSVPVKVRH
jgi:hypothetical protein